MIAPWREWQFRGRADLIAYAEQHGIPVPVTAERPYSTDANLLHVSYEGGVLEDPWAPPPPGMFQRTTDPEAAPDTPEWVTITFQQGNPVAVDGEDLGRVDLLTRLNDARRPAWGGRVDMVENRFIGMKSRGVYETPGGTLLYHAHRAVESITLDREVSTSGTNWCPGTPRWSTTASGTHPERVALQAFMDDVQTRVNGDARLKLYKGSVTIEGRRSETHTLYDRETATFEADDIFNQGDAGGFIRLQALRLRTLAEKRLGEGE